MFYCKKKKQKKIINQKNMIINFIKKSNEKALKKIYSKLIESKNKIQCSELIYNFLKLFFQNVEICNSFKYTEILINNKYLFSLTVPIYKPLNLYFSKYTDNVYTMFRCDFNRIFIKKQKILIISEFVDFFSNFNIKEIYCKGSVSVEIGNRIKCGNRGEIKRLFIFDRDVNIITPLYDKKVKDEFNGAIKNKMDLSEENLIKFRDKDSLIMKTISRSTINSQDLNKIEILVKTSDNENELINSFDEKLNISKNIKNNISENIENLPNENIIYDNKSINNDDSNTKNHLIDHNQITKVYDINKIMQMLISKENKITILTEFIKLFLSQNSKSSLLNFYQNNEIINFKKELVYTFGIELLKFFENIEIFKLPLSIPDLIKSVEKLDICNYKFDRIIFNSGDGTEDVVCIVGGIFNLEIEMLKDYIILSTGIVNRDIMIEELMK